MDVNIWINCINSLLDMHLHIIQSILQLIFHLREFLFFYPD